MTDDMMKVAHFVIELLAHAHWLAILLVHQDPELPNHCEYEMLANPPPELGVEDGSVLRIGQDHQAVVGQLLANQGLVAFADMELVDVSFHERLKRLWTQERVRLWHVEAG